MQPHKGGSIFPYPNRSVEGGINSLPGIRVKDNESFESALRRFKKKCEKAGILSDLRKHQHFEKPSEKRKRKENAARRKMQALQRSQQG
jgi:small subunit ribosomal protein S21